MNSNRLGNLRIYLWAALAMLLLYDYQAWMRDYAPPPSAAAPSAAGAAGAVGAPGAAGTSGRLLSRSLGLEADDALGAEVAVLAGG